MSTEEKQTTVFDYLTEENGLRRINKKDESNVEYLINTYIDALSLNRAFTNEEILLAIDMIFAHFCDNPTYEIAIKILTIPTVQNDFTLELFDKEKFHQQFRLFFYVFFENNVSRCLNEFNTILKAIENDEYHFFSDTISKDLLIEELYDAAFLEANMMKYRKVSKNSITKVEKIVIKDWFTASKIYKEYEKRFGKECESYIDFIERYEMVTKDLFDQVKSYTYKGDTRLQHINTYSNFLCSGVSPYGFFVHGSKEERDFLEYEALLQEKALLELNALEKSTETILEIKGGFELWKKTYLLLHEAENEDSTHNELLKGRIEKFLK